MLYSLLLGEGDARRSRLRRVAETECETWILLRFPGVRIAEMAVAARRQESCGTILYVEKRWILSFPACMIECVMASIQKELDLLDRQIGSVERKLGILQRKRDGVIGAQIKEKMAQVAELESQLSQTPAAPAKKKRGMTLLGLLPVVGKKARRKKKRVGGKKKRVGIARKGRGKGKRSRVAREDALERLSVILSSAGAEGISGREAAKQAGISYGSALKILNGHFKKVGRARGGRFVAG